ncbi:MAG: PilN domain-containing protein [Phycisphaeraceae bacterium]|nr:PilN domain-containing protein [Phycisphaeraceae bacterium]
MISANLLPASHRRHLSRQDRTARWSIVIAVYAVVLAVLWLGSRQYVAGGRFGLERRVAAIDAEVAGINSGIAGLKEKAVRVQASLSTARSIADHPDWSVLLSLIASLKSADIEVDRVALGPRTAEAKPGGAKSVKGVWVRLSGFAKDHQAIAHFALRLEGAHLFDRVALEDARKNAAEPEGLVGFEIEAQIDEPAGGSK